MGSSNTSNLRMANLDAICGWSKVVDRGSKSWRSWVLSSILVLVWRGYEMATIKGGEARDNRTWRWAQMASTMEADRKLTVHKESSWAYANGFPFENLGIRFNGAGWDREMGRTEACVSLFVENPNNIILDVKPATNNYTNSANCYEGIQAKIGLEYLRRKEIELTTRGAKISFAKPMTEQYHSGMELANLAMMAPEKLSTGHSKFRLLQASWHAQESPRSGE